MKSLIDTADFYHTFASSLVFHVVCVYEQHLHHRPSSNKFKFQILRDSIPVIGSAYPQVFSPHTAYFAGGVFAA